MAAWLAAGVMVSLFLTGCLGAPHETDLPWAKQQPWEGAPLLPPGLAPTE